MIRPVAPPPKPAIDEMIVDQVCSEFEHKPGAMLNILETLQKRNMPEYLPREVLAMIARRMAAPLSQIYSVATFYTFFNLKPQGKHVISICRGTACHTRGSAPLLSYCKERFGLEVSEEDEDESALTTDDMQYTVRTVACIGQCAMAPVIEFDRKIYGNVNHLRLGKLIDELEEEGVVR